jgi:hypothetical protein
MVVWGVGRTCSIGCQGPSKGRACIAGGAVRVRLGLFETTAKSGLIRVAIRDLTVRIHN